MSSKMTTSFHVHATKSCLTQSTGACLAHPGLTQSTGGRHPPLGEVLALHRAQESLVVHPGLTQSTGEVVHHLASPGLTQSAGACLAHPGLTQSTGEAPTTGRGPGLTQSTGVLVVHPGLTQSTGGRHPPLGKSWPYTEHRSLLGSPRPYSEHGGGWSLPGKAGKKGENLAQVLKGDAS